MPANQQRQLPLDDVEPFFGVIVDVERWTATRWWGMPLQDGVGTVGLRVQAPHPEAPHPEAQEVENVGLPAGRCHG